MTDDEKFTLVSRHIISSDEDWYNGSDRENTTPGEFDFTTDDETASEAETPQVKTPEIGDSCMYKLPKVSISQSTIKEDYTAYYNGYSDQFIKCMNETPTTYHFISHFKSVLENNGFNEVKENDFAEYKAGFYYIVKDDLSLIAFVIGGKWQPRNGSCFTGTHCDALSIKLNPSSERSRADGYELLGVAPYSGSLGIGWFDRDLGLAGAVLVRESTGKVRRKLISTGSKPVAIIPSLAEHFGVPLSQTTNPQTQAVPVLGHGIEDLEPTDEEKASPLYSKHSLSLLRLVSKLSGTPLSQIINFDLDLVNVQPAVRGGLNNEFLYASSLDDRLCSFDAMYGLLEFSKQFYTDRDIEDYDGFSGVYFANNEEIGSATRTGAGGGFLLDTFRSVINSRAAETPEESLAQLSTNTIILSSDVTHAFNPNYANAYLKDNYPLINTGPSVKFDVSKHVLSDPEGWVFLQNIVDAHLPGITLQKFHIRNDSRSGGTIGPIMGSAVRGINGAALIIDVGMPILAMHAFRSVAGYKDIGMGVRFFREVYNHWQKNI